MELNSITPYESKVLLSDGSGCSEFPNPNGYHVEWWEWLIWTHTWNWIQSPPTNPKFCWVMGVGALNSPTLMDIMLSNGGGCFESPNPNGYHVEWWEWLFWTRKWNWIQSPPTNPKFCWVMGVGALNSPTLMDIMLSNGSGCYELPNPNGYHVE